MRAILFKSILSIVAFSAMVSQTSAMDPNVTFGGAETQLYGVYKEQENAKSGNRNMEISAFSVKADVTGTATWDDNIYATDGNEESDTIVTIRPEVKVDSQWSRHALGAKAFINDNRYMSNDSEDHTEFGGEISGQLDIKRGTYVAGSLMAERRFEDRGNPNSLSVASEPTEYARRGGEVRVVHAPGRVSLSGGIKRDELEFEDGVTSANVVLNNGDRDRMQTTLSTRVGYEVRPGYETYGKLSYVDTEYEEVDLAVGDKRSSDGYDAVVGLAMDVTGKVQGDVYVGISERSYNAASLEDLSEMTLGGNILYRPNGLTSVKVGLKRSLEETVEAGAAAYVQTALTGRVEHALRRNVLVGAHATLAQNTYEGGTSNREDDLLVLGLDGRYDLGNNLTASAGYEWTERDSNSAGADYTRGRFMTRLLGQF